MNLEIPPYLSSTLFPLCLFSFNAEHMTTEAGNSLGVGIAQVHILLCVAVWKFICKGEQTHNQRFRWNLLCKMRAFDIKRRFVNDSFGQEDLINVSINKWTYTCITVELLAFYWNIMIIFTRMSFAMHFNRKRGGHVAGDFLFFYIFE